MFCRNCGVKLADSDKFCSNCGSKVGTVGDSAAAFEAPIVKAPKVEAAPAVDVPKVEAAPAVVAQAQINQVAASPAVCEQAGAEANVKYVPMDQKSSSKAITGFVLSLVGLLLFHLTCGIIGLIFSIKGMRETKNGEYSGRGLAIAGLSVSILDIVVGSIWIVYIIILFSIGMAAALGGAMGGIY